MFGSVHSETVALTSHVSSDKRWNVRRLEKPTPECGFTIKLFFALLPKLLTTFDYKKRKERKKEKEIKGYNHKSKYFKETNFFIFSDIVKNI